MKTRNGRILAMPYPIETNDNRASVWFRYTSSELADMLIDNFEEMLDQSLCQPLGCPIALHPFVMGRP
jgi:allantoinase